MATQLETKIMEALFECLSSFVYNPVLPVAWPLGGAGQKPYQPVVGQPYLKVNYMPGETNGFPVTDGPNQHVGIFQVSVFWPPNQGQTAPTEAAGALVAHFKRGTVRFREGVKVKIRDHPSLGPVIEEPDWVQIPVSVPYQAFTPNP